MAETLSAQELRQAYDACREIARREAKNFYYSFLVLPRHKSDAMCAVYAFMRRADDIADDESHTIDERRVQMAEWTAEWLRVQAGGASADPVFLALRDTQQRFNIPIELLQQLVQGVAMDLEASALPVRTLSLGGSVDQSFQVYERFDELYRYCYLVASVVGLVCIRIFGYDDAHAEELAERTGIAFQLTNILRDVREDAERGRVYLPQEDFEKFSVDAGELVRLKDGHHMTLNQRELMEYEAQRAQEYYRAAHALLPLIHADSRPALWVLVTIYRTLLVRIEARGFDVFSNRISVGTMTKLGILLRGTVQSLLNRVTA